MISCVIFDPSTGKLHAGIDRGGLEGAGPLFEILKSSVPLHGGEPNTRESSTRQALIVGAQQTAFACVSGSGKWLVLIVTSNSFSVALGWSLLRRVAAAAEVAA